MQKIFYLLASLTLVIGCQSSQKQPQSCIVTDNLIGKQYLDSTYLASVKNIKTDENLSQSTSGMVFIKGGVFNMGGDLPKGFENMPETALAQPDEFPKHQVQVFDFYMDEHEVTVAQFAEFVKATGYKTVAEQDIIWEEIKKQMPLNTPKPADSLLKAGALVFHYVPKNTLKNDLANWWTYTPGVNWKNPDEKNRPFEEIKNFPVTQISYYDALAYAKWKGGRLPTEAEFEYAMRAGKDNEMYPWGNSKVTENVAFGNFLQGDFPYENTTEDGYKDVAPVKQFLPNAYGLYDISGNVWEWTNDWYAANYYQTLAQQNTITINPKGPEKSYEVYNPKAINKSVKGGSFLCNDSWCSGYRNSRRMRLSPDTGMQHLGFRLVKDIKK